jgi:glycosyltransferase involved in cell wall biosynthesis
MKISIALCTYNGALFIEEQLQSLTHQTCLPDELVVCDDGSTDATLATVSAFAARAPFKVLYARNEQQLGITKNFERAIARCSGDVIFLCDQDDVWLPEKIQTLMQAFKLHDDVGLVFSDAVVTDAKLNRFDYTMWQTVEFTPKWQRQMNDGQGLSILVRRYVVTGATLAFRARLREQILPIPPGYFHDAWVAAVSAMGSRIVAIKTPLILYRQHGANAIGGVRMNWFTRLRYALQLKPEWFDLEIERARHLRDKLRLAGGHAGNGRHFADLERRIVHLESRRAIFNLALMPRLSLIAREVCSLRYSIFSGGLKAALLDLITKGKGRRTGTRAWTGSQ